MFLRFHVEITHTKWVGIQYNYFYEAQEAAKENKADQSMQELTNLT